MEGALLLDVVVREGATVLELLAGEDQPLLVRGDPLLVLKVKVSSRTGGQPISGRNGPHEGRFTHGIYLDLGLHILDGVRGLNLKSDGLAGEGLDEDLHPATEPQDEVEGALLLDVVVGEGPTVLELLAGEDQPLLVRGDPLLVLKKVY